MVTLSEPPGPIIFPFPPPSSVKGGLCFGAVTLTVNGPVPVLLIVMVPDAVASGTALKFNVFRLQRYVRGPAVQ